METTIAQREFVQRLLTAAPEAMDIEKAYLGGILVDPAWILDTPLKPQDFFSARHAVIFRAMLALRSTNQPVDCELLSEVLENGGELKNTGGRAYLLELANSLPNSLHTPHYAETIRAASIRRQYLQALDEARATVLDESKTIESTAAQVEKIVGSVTMDASRGGLEHISDAISADVARLDAMFEDGVKPTIGVPVFLKPLENVLRSWRLGRLYYVGGYMHSGKSTFIMQAALGAARQGAVVAIFNTEGRREDVQREMVSIAAGVASDRVATGSLTIAEYARYSAVAAEVAKLTIFADADESIDTDQLYRRVRTLKNSFPDKPLVVFVDYLGKLSLPERMAGKIRDRRGEMSYFSKAMKKTAETLDVAMICAAQTARPERPSKARGKDDEPRRPVAQDLAESADLERDADVILFPWRVNPSEVDGEIVVAKNKVNGWNGSVPCMFDKSSRQWREFSAPRPSNTDDITWRPRHDD